MSNFAKKRGGGLAPRVPTPMRVQQFAKYSTMYL